MLQGKYFCIFLLQIDKKNRKGLHNVRDVTEYLLSKHIKDETTVVSPGFDELEIDSKKINILNQEANLPDYQKKGQPSCAVAMEAGCCT